MPVRSSKQVLIVVTYTFNEALYETFCSGMFRTGFSALHCDGNARALAKHVCRPTATSTGAENTMHLAQAKGF